MWLLRAFYCGARLHYVVVFTVCGCKAARLPAAFEGLCQPPLVFQVVPGEPMTLFLHGRMRVCAPCVHREGWQMWASLYQGTRLRSSGHLVSGKCQTQEYGAVMWPGKEKTGLTVEMLFSAGKH